MEKLNNKGFILVETLVVAVFVMSIFSILYNNFYPLMSEYERRELYDDIDSKYSAFWIKRMIQDNSYNATNMKNAISSSAKHYKFTCDDITSAEKKNLCNNMLKKLNVKNVYITEFNLANFKAYIKENGSSFSSPFFDYANYLPEYSKISSLNGADYRILVEFYHKIDEDYGIGEDYYTFSTIEVKK